MNRQLSVAPMMDWTDRHCRFFHRLLSPNALLYTEMVTTGALLHGDKERFLTFNTAEQPLALQLGGSDPFDMACCAGFAEKVGFKEVNINVGCPSDRVQQGAIGACLMATPSVVAACVNEMRDAVTIPVTVKTRIGIDDDDSLSFLLDFIGAVAEAGCDTFIIHARKAILKGLSPKENRSIPPLNYERAYEIKRRFSNLTIVVNGGIKTVAEVQQHWQNVDGVMIGREAYHNPYFLAAIEHQLFDQPMIERVTVLHNYLSYVEKQLGEGVSLARLVRPIFGLFAGRPGGKQWRRHLSEEARKNGAGPEVLLSAYEAMSSYTTIN